MSIRQVSINMTVDNKVQMINVASCPNLQREKFWIREIDNNNDITKIGW